MDLKRKMGHWSDRTKITKDGAVPQGASAEIQSPKKKSETQDNVRETLAISQEEAEEMCIVTSVLGEPREMQREGRQILADNFAPIDGMGGVTMSRIATVSRWMTTCGAYQRDTETATMEANTK